MVDKVVGCGLHGTTGGVRWDEGVRATRPAVTGRRVSDRGGRGTVAP